MYYDRGLIEEYKRYRKDNIRKINNENNKKNQNQQQSREREQINYNTLTKYHNIVDHMIHNIQMYKVSAIKYKYRAIGNFGLSTYMKIDQNKGYGLIARPGEKKKKYHLLLAADIDNNPGLDYQLGLECQHDLEYIPGVYFWIVDIIQRRFFKKNKITIIVFIDLDIARF